MLDLVKLARQMQDIGQHLNDEAAATRQRLDRAQQFLQEARGRQAELVNLRQMWGDRLGFSAAIPQEPLDTCIPLAPAPPNHTVLATDGSQIAPSHHEIAYCYLINVGRIVLHYGQNRHPLLDSLPEIFYRPEDLYSSRQWGISTEEWMGYRRTASEATVLAELAAAEMEGRELRQESLRVEERAGGQKTEAMPSPPPPASLSPTLAMVDGSLTHWFLDPLPAEARDRILLPILDAWETLRLLRVPLVGYLSAARSGESLNFLRLHTCPKDQPDCQSYCPGQTDIAPCQVFAPLRDTALWGIVLKPGQRSAIWRSSARILDYYDHHRTYFCYVHMGSEIARVEFPAWVAEDAELLNAALSLTMTQVDKGQGYPVALAEAHNQAVVRGGDRARFFALLEQQMIRAGLKNVAISYKEARKRGSIA
ncbi:MULTISPECIES: DNA double-strand break repair nuclease NurA [unclassified Leptolyngbya]|uniref:DNA double-strand break repair nuclease NurA n=1 Tax=unclassified Leptolyngbya TaxID=2650499 RepID=UPI0016848F58|nr:MULTISPECIES: DNA double-strand break repair nuclease NurA [unclassified Leptolyngbya]MBD1909538.1 DNA double-strand break repair nuclease NurA [Leptolyngbya sp. FACHB-8]MBD2154616.1 DNA double-strand break repair nuclease NurA [Leptolyngbya sp. FACHB-16]